MADPRYIEAITTNPDLESLLLHPDTGAQPGMRVK